MIKQLRIGNYVLDSKNEIRKIAGIEDECVHLLCKDCDKASFSEITKDIKPIPLSEEILFKLGFGISSDEGDAIYYQLNPKLINIGYGIKKDHDDWSFYQYRMDYITILIYDKEYFQYVHHLQNLFLDLQNIELNFKTK